MNQDRATISVPEAGRRLGIGRNSAYEAARRGTIPAIRIGKLLRVPVAALDRLLADAGKQAQADKPSNGGSVELP